MSVDDRGYVWRWLAAVVAETRLSALYRVIVLDLGLHADYETGRNAYPSARTIAETVNCSRNTVGRALAQAVRLGYLKRDGRKGRGGSIRYRLLVPEVAHLIGEQVPSEVAQPWGEQLPCRASEVAHISPEVAHPGVSTTRPEEEERREPPPALRSSGSPHSSVTQEVREIVREVAAGTKIPLDSEILAEQISRLSTSWPREVVVGVAVPRLKAIRRKATNPSRYLAADLSRIHPATYELPADLRGLLDAGRENVDGDDADDPERERREDELDAFLDRLRVVDADEADRIDRFLDHRLTAWTDPDETQRVYIRAIHRARHALSKHHETEGP